MKKKQAAEHDNADRWLLTYADLITLLLGLFVILYAVSSLNASKYNEITTAFKKIFGVGKAQNQGGILPHLPIPSESGSEDKSLFALMDRISSSLKEYGEGSHASVQMEVTERGLVIHLSEQLFFDSGQADIKLDAKRSLDQVAHSLLEIPNDIRIEGHTDNVPIHTFEFPSNWHLSTERAVNTAMYLIDRHGFPTKRLSVAGYSEYRPLVANDTAVHRARNRRVDIVVLRSKESKKEPHSYASQLDDKALPTVLDALATEAAAE